MSTTKNDKKTTKINKTQKQENRQNQKK